MNITRTQNQPNFKAGAYPKNKNTVTKMAKELTSYQQYIFRCQKEGMENQGASAVEHYYEYVGLDPERGPLFHVKTGFPNANGKDGFFTFSTNDKEPVAANGLVQTAREFVEKGRRALKYGLTQEQAETMSAKDCEKLEEKWSPAYKTAPKPAHKPKKARQDFADYHFWEPI